MNTAQWTEDLALGASMFDTANQRLFLRLPRLDKLADKEFSEA